MQLMTLCIVSCNSFCCELFLCLSTKAAECLADTLSDQSWNNNEKRQTYTSDEYLYFKYSIKLENNSVLKADKRRNSRFRQR